MDIIRQLFVDPLQFEFMQRAVLSGLIFGIVSGIIGAFVVTRGMAFLGDALAHSILPGVAIAFVTGGSSQVFIGALIAAILSALGIGFLTRGRRLTEDTAIGIVFTGMLALGIGIIATTRSYATDLTHFMFGNILAVTQSDLNLMALIAFVVVLVIVALYKELLVVSFDTTLAETLRLPTEQLRLVLLILLAVTIVVGIQTMGVALISAMLITPAATAHLLARRLHTMMALSALIASSCSVIGMYLAWHLQVPPSASIVLTMTVLFILLFLFAPRKGYVWSLLRQSAKPA